MAAGTALFPAEEAVIISALLLWNEAEWCVQQKPAAESTGGKPFIPPLLPFPLVYLPKQPPFHWEPYQLHHAAFLYADGYFWERESERKKHTSQIGLSYSNDCNHNLTVGTSVELWYEVWWTQTVQTVSKHSHWHTKTQITISNTLISYNIVVNWNTAA